MTYFAGQIPGIFEGHWLQLHAPAARFEHLLIDSRQVHDAEFCLFFAFKGVRQNGLQFIPALYHNGVRNFIVNERLGLEEIPEANVFFVEDVLAALQGLARFHRSKFHYPVVAITGSNGKTVIKEWLFQLLSGNYSVVKSPKSYNSQIGVPLSVWQMHPRADLAIFEAGVSREGEMAAIESILQPDFAVFSNLGSAHDEGFINREHKLNEKLRLFKGVRKAVCCKDHPLVFHGLMQQSIPVFTWSRLDRDADIYVTGIDQTGEFTTIHYRYQKEFRSVQIPFQDDASIENSLQCLSLIKLLEPDGHQQYDRRFAQLLPIEMRLEAVEGLNQCVLVNDVYNADLESLKVALAFAHFQSRGLKKTIILTDLKQQHNTPGLYQSVAGLLDPYHYSRIIAIGEEVVQLGRWLTSGEFHYFSGTDEFIAHLPEFVFANELILLKGARNYGLERVTELLSSKKHQTVLEINLGALARNLKIFESLLISRTTKIMAMVKAEAYGSGSVEIARFLQSRHVDYLAVAYLDESIALREAGIELPIMVMNADISSLSLMTRYSVEPEVFSMDQIKVITRFTQSCDTEIKIHIKVESGMNRLGFIEDDLEVLIELIKKTPRVVIASIFSHLAASDDPNESIFTLSQFDRFQRFADRLTAHLPYRPMRHIANSQAIRAFPQMQLDMVRIGMGMYGIGMPESLKLEPVHTFRSFVSQVRSVEPGSTIGYGRREKVEKSIILATIAVGYADGLIRKAGNRRYAVEINGQLAPIVGNICMDMTMVDVSGIPQVKMGTPVTIFGVRPTVDQLALAADTIPYEVFTGLSGRIKRVYTYD